MQEKVLSKCLLIFIEFQVYWHCDSAICAEDTVLEVSQDTRDLGRVVEHYEEFSGELRRIYKLSPNYSADYQYVSLLRSYKTRSLSDPSDAVNGFTGILKTLERRLGSDHRGAADTIFQWSNAMEIRGPLSKSSKRIPELVLGWVGRW